MAEVSCEITHRSWLSSDLTGDKSTLDYDRQQVIIWVNADWVLCRHMTSQYHAYTTHDGKGTLSPTSILKWRQSFLLKLNIFVAREPIERLDEDVLLGNHHGYGQSTRCQPEYVLLGHGSSTVSVFGLWNVKAMTLLGSHPGEWLGR